MPRAYNVVEILKLLDKSNCGECGEKTCLAFASSVFRGAKPLSGCPRLDPETARLADGVPPRKDPAEDAARGLEILKQRVSRIDLAQAAARTGGRFERGRLAVKMLGKDVWVDAGGNLFTEIHVHPWIMTPLLTYILTSKGTPPAGEWVPFRDLPEGKAWEGLFGQRCEKPMKKVADDNPDLFEDMVQVFSGRKVQGHFDSDIGCVLHPLPRVPLLVCYWKPEDGLESDLHLFFDSTAADNLPLEALYALAAGFSRMLEKVVLRHGFSPTPAYST